MVNPVKKEESIKFCPFCGKILEKFGTLLWCRKDKRYFNVSENNEEIETWIEENQEAYPHLNNFNPSSRS